VPADRSSWGTGSILSSEVQESLKTLLEQVAQRGGAAGSNEQKVADFYNAFMDTDAINAKGVGPAQAEVVELAIAPEADAAVNLFAVAVGCDPKHEAALRRAAEPGGDAGEGSGR